MTVEIETITRMRCAVTGDADLEVIDRIPDFPIYMGCVNTREEDDIFADAVWAISRPSGILQLLKLIPLSLLYQEQHSSGVVGELWMRHHRAFAEFLHMTEPISVFEIGGAHGILATEYRNYQTLDWTILEPNPTPVRGCPARYVRGFFMGKDDIPDGRPTIVHSHVFEHLYEPREFIRSLSESMSIGQKMVFSVPNMREMLVRGYTNCLNFEHTVFLTENAIDRLLAEFGFVIENKRLFLEDHSIFYVVSRSESMTPPQKDLVGDYVSNLNLYESYKERYVRLIAAFNESLSHTHSLSRVFLFGAHVFSQYLIFNGLDTKRIDCILDNDPAKQDRRMYGTHFQVKSPAVLADETRPVVILCAGVYNNEIKTSILEGINSTTIFLEDPVS